MFWDLMQPPPAVDPLAGGVAVIEAKSLWVVYHKRDDQGRKLYHDDGEPIEGRTKIGLKIVLASGTTINVVFPKPRTQVDEFGGRHTVDGNWSFSVCRQNGQKSGGMSLGDFKRRYGDDMVSALKIGVAIALADADDAA